MSDNGMFSLDGLTAVVIGGGGVLAGSMAEGLADAGASIAILDVSQEAAEARAAAIRSRTGRKAIGIKTDATSKPVSVSPVTEATTLGAAYLAGLATGVWPSTAKLAAQWDSDRVFEPAMSRDQAGQRMADWDRAVRQSIPH